MKQINQFVLVVAIILGTIASGTASAQIFEIVCGNQPGGERPVERAYLATEFRTQTLASGPFQEFADAIDAFNRHPSDLIYFGPVSYNNYSVGLNNGHNDVWSTSEDLFGVNQALLYYNMVIDACWIIESDAVFNANASWITANIKNDYNAYGDNPTDFSALPLSLWALTRVTGLLPDCSLYSTTGDTFEHFATNGLNASVYLGEDTVAGLISLYSDEEPALLASPDLSVVHWRHDACINGFGEHRRTEVFGTDGNVLDRVQGEVEPRFVAAAGQTIEAEFTFENLGNTLEEGVLVGFYWSDDDAIIEDDRRIGGTSIDFVQNVPDTRRVTVDLPIDLAQGDGYLGVIVDDAGELDELYDANNATYVPMRIEGQDLDGDGNPDETGETYYRYAAKVVCGISEDGDDLRLRPGVYGTTVNVFNPDFETVRFDKRLAVSFPPDPQIQGETYSLGLDSLDPLHALETNCNTLIEEAFEGTSPEPYFEGFVVITSPKSLDVTAVYTTSPPDPAMMAASGVGGPEDFESPQRTCYKGCGHSCCTGCCDCCPGGGGNGGDGNGGGHASQAAGSIDVEQIRERVVEVKVPDDDGPRLPDLVPEEPFPPAPEAPEDPFEDPDAAGPNTLPQHYCVAPEGGGLAEEIRVRVRNIGNDSSGPSNIRVEFNNGGSPVQSIGGLAAGASTFRNFDIPNQCYGGNASCSFRIAVDRTPEEVAESSEANNLANGSCPGNPE